MTRKVERAKKQKQPGKLGQPTKYDRTLCDVVIKLGAEGKSRAQIAALLKVARGTLYAWEDAYPEFAEAMEHAQDLAQAWWEDMGQGGLKQGSAFNANVFAFQMKNRFKDYRDVSTHELTGKDGAPLLAPPPSTADLATSVMQLLGAGALAIPMELTATDVTADGDDPRPSLPAANDPVPVAPPRISLALGEREVLANGAEIVFVEAPQRYAVHDATGCAHGYRSDLAAARELAESLKAPVVEKSASRHEEPAAVDLPEWIPREARLSAHRPTPRVLRRRPYQP